MSWFKVDDSFYDHPKFLDVPNAAIGLWAKSGAWCGKHLTDGVIPASQVKLFKGTPAQIKSLVLAGIWIEDRNENGAKVYRFHDWNEYQPSREQKLKEREDAAERQRKSRERKAQEQQKRENVTRDSHVTGSCDSHESHNHLSQRPDPTRPDPTYYMGTTSQPTNGDLWPVDNSQAQQFQLSNEHGAAIARARQAGISDTAIQTGINEFKRRPQPKGPGLLRLLIDDAHQAIHTNELADKRREAINACSLCDTNGLAVQDGVAHRCNHQPADNQETA
ncbi:hypothetical protein H0194_04750 [Corynebacterium incognita]|uniref:Uncharacterized protein n=1 Tax=Corynebacterium incognita TaxID=2754725 RepID=A0A7G7CRS3_9CORY|nr:hypothetical protein [Corynebacterium incognita]QNE90289.1 hypothetical protein H0194_04750 [Corynebacterium incognita]